MTTGERLYQLSPLPFGTTLQHLAAIELNPEAPVDPQLPPGEIIYICGVYSVIYKGESANAVNYLPIPKTSVKYIKQRNFKVNYVGEKNHKAVYIQPSKIKITWLCNE